MNDAGTNTPWNEAEVKTLLTLHASGLSCSKIANAMAGGKTRNAVIGKLYRLGLVHGKPSALDKEPAPRKSRARTDFFKPSLPALTGLPVRKLRALFAPTPVTARDEKITILTLQDGMCKWPIGDPQHTDFYFCGNPHFEGPYCEYHAGIAYQPVVQRRMQRRTG